MSLTKATYSMIQGTPANVLDYGAVGDGVADDTAAIQAALNGASATTYRDVILPAGNFLISATIEIPEGVSLIGQGNRSAFNEGVEGQPSKITKKSTMTTVGVKLSGKRSRLQNLGVYSQTGATNDGVWLAANYCSLVNVSSNGHGGAGIRIGSTPAGYVNCNGWYLEQITASFNTSHGVIIDDQFTAYPLNDANAGVFNGGDMRSNGDDGVFVGNCFANTFIGILTEQNVGYGMFFDNESTKHTVLGGDQDEGNTVGVIYNNGLYNTFVGVLSSGFVDNGDYTNLLGFTTNTLNRTTFRQQIRITPSTLIDLGSAATAGAGARAHVSDSTVAGAGNFGLAVVGGGANSVPVYSDGVNWRIG